MKNRYVARARISEAQFRRIVRYFVADMQANRISELTGLSRNSINAYFKAMRLSIVTRYTDFHRVSLTESAMHFFGIYYRDYRLVIEPLSLPATEDLFPPRQPISTERLQKRWAHRYDALLHYETKRIYPLTHHERSGVAVVFWQFSRERLAKFRGISADNTLLHLKECEFRFNNRHRDLYRMLLQHFRKYPLRLGA